MLKIDFTFKGLIGEMIPHVFQLLSTAAAIAFRNVSRIF